MKLSFARLSIRPLCWLTLASVCLIAGFVWTVRTRAQQPRAQVARGQDAPTINADEVKYDADADRLVVRGARFDPAAQVVLRTAEGRIVFRALTIVDDTTIWIEGLPAAAWQGALRLTVRNPVVNANQPATSTSVELDMHTPERRANTRVSVERAVPAAPDQTTGLTAAEVEQIIAQAAVQADALNLRASIAVVDAEGRILGVFRMTGAPDLTRVGILQARCRYTGAPGGEPLPLPCGLEGVSVPSCTAAISKAVTGSFLSSQGHAFSPRTASFIVQEHFPPAVRFQPSGPLFGVQFSQFLCSDVNPRAPLGLSADAGGFPLYKNGIKVGGIGVEGDGRYTADQFPAYLETPPEEIAALAGQRGFAPPDTITADKIIVNGIRFAYSDVAPPPALPARPLAQIPGVVDPCVTVVVNPTTTVTLAPTAVRAAPPSEFRVETIADAPPGRINTRLFPQGALDYRSSPDLSRAEVIRILAQGAKQAFLTRAAIRQPLNSSAEVNLTVCDVNGRILGIFSTIDAPLFGFDVSAQKARSAAFFSNPNAAAQLRAAGLGRYVDAAVPDGVRLDGALAFSDRAIGFLARPFYPDGFDNTPHGPFSVPIQDFSPFNVGFQLDVVRETYFENIIRFLRAPNTPAGRDAILDALTPPCSNPALLEAFATGAQIFPGSVPLYKNGRLVGALGISGDGVDQDDIVSAMGSFGFESPEAVRTDQVLFRGTRLPFVKFPRNPNRQ